MCRFSIASGHLIPRGEFQVGHEGHNVAYSTVGQQTTNKNVGNMYELPLSDTPERAWLS
jgi:hypothetical protein